MRMNGAPSVYGPEYDDPANCDMESHTYASYSNTNPQLPPDFGGSPSHNTMARRSVGSIGPVRNMMTLPPYPEPPMVPIPPPRIGNDSVNVSSSSNNDSTVSAEISEAECDREHLVNRNYGGKSISVSMRHMFLISKVRRLTFMHRFITSKSIDIACFGEKKNKQTIKTTWKLWWKLIYALWKFYNLIEFHFSNTQLPMGNSKRIGDFKCSFHHVTQFLILSWLLLLFHQSESGIWTARMGWVWKKCGSWLRSKLFLSYIFYVCSTCYNFNLSL